MLPAPLENADAQHANDASLRIYFVADGQWEDKQDALAGVT